MMILLCLYFSAITYVLNSPPRASCFVVEKHHRIHARWATRPDLSEDERRTTNGEESSTVNGFSSTNEKDNLVEKSDKAKQNGKRRKRKRMELMWCNKDYCKDVVRERTVGDHNQIILTGPATGQVAYAWSSRERKTIKPAIGSGAGLFVDGTSDSSSSTINDDSPDVASCSVLLLVKQGDDELMSIAADAVRNITSLPDVNINVLLDPSVAARIKHYHGVDGDRIHLFEAVVPTPGFGDNLRQRLSLTDLDDFFGGDSDVLPPWKLRRGIDKNGKPSKDEIKDRKLERRRSGLKGDHAPDLICTLGGDGLLMHAGMMFQGPIPPILCVAGGSMGFLTPFHVSEMVEAVIIALGMISDRSLLCEDSFSRNVKDAATQNGDTTEEINVFPPNMYGYPYEPLDSSSMIPRLPDVSLPAAGDSNYFFSYGRNNNLRICLSIRMRLECRIINREGVARSRWNVLNEVVIDRGGSPYLAALECFCDNEHLTTVQADGIIFATPTGSTAYSLAAGSSVVHPAVPCILVTPICPHVLSFRSMVFPDHVTLRCFVPLDARADASVAFDGKHRQELRRGDSVLIQMSPYPVPTINRKDHSADWLHSLKRNFNFNARPRQRPLQS